MLTKSPFSCIANQFITIMHISFVPFRFKLNHSVLTSSQHLYYNGHCIINNTYCRYLVRCCRRFKACFPTPCSFHCYQLLKVSIGFSQLVCDAQNISCENLLGCGNWHMNVINEFLCNYFMQPLLQQHFLSLSLIECAWHDPQHHPHFLFQTYYGFSYQIICMI